MNSDSMPVHTDMIDMIVYMNAIILNPSLYLSFNHPYNNNHQVLIPLVPYNGVDFIQLPRLRLYNEFFLIVRLTINCPSIDSVATRSSFILAIR